MKPLIDGDILLYEIGATGQYVDPESGELVIRDFQFVQEKLHEKVDFICAEVWATEPPVLYLTNNHRIHKKFAKKLKKEKIDIEQLKDLADSTVGKYLLDNATQAEKLGKVVGDFIPNFRDKIATEKVYKGQRVQEKPFHYENLMVYIIANFETVIAVGMEADDLLSVHQYERVKSGKLDTIICSRDKDLRITPGMHYGWECGKQRSFGPLRVTDLGRIELVKTSSGNKIIGTGLKFFYSQILTGDVTDHYGGLQGCGAVAAHKSLHDCTSEAELFERVAGLYQKKLGDGWRESMLEQAQLAWMVRELDEEGLPVMYRMYDELG